MEDYSFRDKYKKITDLPILANHQLGIPLLKAIHYYLFEDDKIDNSIRYSSDSYIYQTISTRMEEIFELINCNISIDDYIRKVCICIATFFMYQPFSDGNTRTCLVLQKLLLSQKNLHIDLDEGCVSGHDLIGIMYDEYDVPKSAIEKVKRKVGIQQ